MTRSDLERVVSARVWSDPAFRRALLADPSAALAGLAPVGVRVEVVCETPDALYLVLAGREAGEADGVERRIAARAAADPSFRAGLLAEPVAALELEPGVRVPEGVRVRVLEETETYWPIVLPAGPMADPLGPELPTLALAAAGGGRTDRPTVDCTNSNTFDARPSAGQREAATRGC